MSDVALSAVFANQRRKLYTITSSDAAIAIPSWAQNGKAMAYVTACGGGGGGAVRATTGTRGGGGAGSGAVLRLPVPVPPGISTFSATIGAGGSGPSATSQTDGGNGGDTTVSIGPSISLTISGALGGLGTAGAGLANTSTIKINKQSNVTSTAQFPSQSGIFDITQSYLVGGITAGAGNNSAQGYGAGGSSFFGTGGAGIAASPSAKTAGADGTGYGAGGAGALWLSGGAVKAGDGAPGFLQIEFVEGF